MSRLPLETPIDLRVTLDRQLRILAIDTTADFETFHLDTNAVGKSLEELGPAVHDLIDAVHEVLAHGRPILCERLDAFAGATAILEPIASQTGVVLGVEVGLAHAAEADADRMAPSPAASQTLEAFAARLFAQLSLEHVACE
ncbi:MAG TPA: hypothetical protein VFT99_04210, partial [Roseiflexaceae bacterium]|nr:hypothetical protein [Roseiflexaceae bacterium]